MNNEQLIPMVSITVYYRGIKKRQRSVKLHSIELLDLKESDFTDLSDYKVQAMAKLTEDAKSYDRAKIKVTYWEAINEGSFTIKRANLFDDRNKELSLC